MTELQSLLKKQWVKRDGTPDTKMVEYCMKSSTYIDIGPYYINIGDKPSIDSTIWYDDETDGPDDSQFEVFRNYNIRYKRFDLDLSNGRQVWIFNNSTYDRTGGKIKSWLTTSAWEEPTHVGEYRLATADDIGAIKQGLAEMKAAYEKRLATYWKRYSNKVHAAGYWANR